MKSSRCAEGQNALDALLEVVVCSATTWHRLAREGLTVARTSWRLHHDGP